MSDPGAAWVAVAEGFKTLRALGRGISEPIQEIVGMGTDHLKVVRFERQARLADRVRAVMREHDIEQLDRRIPLNTLLPLLEHSSLEEDDELQDTWARMLINAGDAANPREVRRAFVSMLAEMTAFDVRNLSTLHRATTEHTELLWTGMMPERAVPYHEDLRLLKPMSSDMKVSLGNLVRVGCIGPLSEAKSPLLYVSVTALGEALIQACTIRQAGA